jgi:hypothetical protein
MFPSYPSLRHFYAADPRRARSAERDVGLWWRDDDDASFRAAWVRETGEIYLVAHGLPEHGGGPVSVIGHTTAGGLDSLLAGWRDVCGRPGSLSWLTAHAGAGLWLAEAA